MIHPAWVSASFDGIDPFTGEAFSSDGYWAATWKALMVDGYIAALAREMGDGISREKEASE